MPGSVVPLRFTLSTILEILLLSGNTLSAVASDFVHLSLPKHRILANELAIVINDADPLSIRIGNYYQQARNIPARNVLHVDFRPGRPGMSNVTPGCRYASITAMTASALASAMRSSLPRRVGRRIPRLSAPRSVRVLKILAAAWRWRSVGSAW